MTRHIRPTYAVLLWLVLWAWSCKIPAVTEKQESKALPTVYGQGTGTDSAAVPKWRQYFSDPNLAALIDTALANNQELNITLKEIDIAKNEVMARKGEYLPFVGIGAAAGMEKTGKYTRNGAVEENLEIKPGKPFPEPLPDFMAGALVSWELDVWKKLRNAKKAAMMRYLSSAEGRNFMVTGIIAEIASSYYELLALDNQLDIVEKNIEIQRNALEIVRMEMNAAKVSQLAVNRFEALLLNTQSRRYEIRQRIVEAENRINFLVGRFPRHVDRSGDLYKALMPDSIAMGIPSQLLINRPDIRKAELELAATRLDVQSARAGFFPSFRITAGVGFQSFNPAFLFRPESILYNLAGDMMAPLVNRAAIKATYLNANAKQVQAAYAYEQTILSSYIEVVNQMARIQNYTAGYETKVKEVAILDSSVDISNKLFRSARADYVEVLLTQREALESRIDLTELRLKQLMAKVMIYKALGGGWN